MHVLDEGLATALSRLDGCAVANAIETFDVRLRNEGFTDGRIRCLFERQPPVIGHAVTARIRSSTPPPVGHNYVDRTDWWTYIGTVPAPRIVVVQDVDDCAGRGALVGEVHAHILRALHCQAYATNGAVRDLEGVSRAGLQLFAGSISVSHAYVHIVDFGCPVEVAGLTVQSGDLLFGDCHGLQSIPPAIASEIPRVAHEMQAREQRVIDFCKSAEFSIDGLRAIINGSRVHRT
ncbi:MAG: RraA family protein [Acidobacteria bacterium]|nr:RraA family protein [Acidobacteriota bacterium]